MADGALCLNNLDNEIKFERKPLTERFFWSAVFFGIAGWVCLKKMIVRHPKVNFYFYDGSSNYCRELKENASRWRSLDIVYNYQLGEENKYADFWSRIACAQAVRNRMRLAKYLLLKIIKETHAAGRPVNIASIACGSAQAVLEAVAGAKDAGIIAKVLLIDLDPEALAFARGMAKKLGILDQVACANEKASAITRLANDFNPTIIEMVGFLEYRPYAAAVKLIKSIKEALSPGGIFLTSQIAPTAESFFMRQVLNWLMIYRKPKEMAAILKETGFDLNNCKFYREPFEFHYVIECRL